MPKEEKFAVFPSRMALQTFKGKTTDFRNFKSKILKNKMGETVGKAAVQGHSILKRKVDALKTKQRAILHKIYDVWILNF